MNENLKLNQQHFNTYLEKMAEDYHDIILDHDKLVEVKESNCPLVDLEDNTKRISNRIARENTSYNTALERINDVNDFVDVIKLQKILEISKSVCRILRNGKPVGTGFLVSENILVTNNHVIGSFEACRDITVQFNYEFNLEGKILDVKSFFLNPEAFFVTSSLDLEPGNELSGLDFTLVAIETVNEQKQRIADIPSLYLDRNLGKIIKGETCILIQHPNGLPKKTTLNNNSFFSETENLLIYETDTLPGSSGSLVLGLGTLEVIALHQRGIPKLDANGNVLTKSGTPANSSTTDDEVDWLGNAGIKISRILDVLQKTDVPSSQKVKKNEILKRSKENKKILQETVHQLEVEEPNKITDVSPSKKDETKIYTNKNKKTPFLILAKNNVSTIEKIENQLKEKFDENLDLFLAMPITAEENKDELFVLQMKVGDENPNEVAQKILKISGIKHAEYDNELALNNSVDRLPFSEALESSSSTDTSTEDYFLSLYNLKSPYVKGKTTEEYRKWNWAASGYSGIDKEVIGKSLKLIQFDTGYVIHPKMIGSFNLDEDFDFVDQDDNAHDDGGKNISFADFGHAARTGSIIAGISHAHLENDGNEGFLFQNQLKIIPYRIARDVIIIGRQAELANAADSAIASGAKVITTSLGLPPTLTTYHIAKKVYENGIIWCCAAGNEVKNVVAPAVHEGTIAIAASNPLDEEWKGSCRGKEVDITAPGMHIYVPRFDKDGKFSMSYGHGTSYATPHVAAAAVLWLSKNSDALQNFKGYQIVEAFRENLKNSARKNHHLPEGFGAGILNIDQLLKQKIPDLKSLKNVYNGKDPNAVVAQFKTLTETLKMLWNGLLRSGRKLISHEESLNSTEEMSSQGQKILAQYANQPLKTEESLEELSVDERFEIYNKLRDEVTS